MAGCRRAAERHPRSATIARPSPDGDGHLLFAIEGFVDDFVEKMPWFAGYSGVMVNVSDIYAMGGRALAVVDAIWARVRRRRRARARRAGRGVAALWRAARRRPQQRAQRARPAGGGDARTRQAPDDELRRPARRRAADGHRPARRIGSTPIRSGMPRPARRPSACVPTWNCCRRWPKPGCADAAKDISMAGVIGTALMLLECSGGCGDRPRTIPRPPGARWPAIDEPALPSALAGAFPSYGFVLSVRSPHVAARCWRVLPPRHRLRRGRRVSEPQVTLRHAGRTAAAVGPRHPAFHRRTRAAQRPADG